MLDCPSCDASISLGLTHVSMGSFVVPDNGKDCLNGCQTFDLGYEQRSDDYLFGGHLINAPPTWSKWPLGSAPARLLRLLRTRLVAPCSWALPGRGPSHWDPGLGLSCSS